MRGVQDGNTPVTQPLNDYGGLLEEAEPGPLARFLAWMRQPRNLLVVGISAVALLVAGGALAMMLPSNGSVPLATDTATPSVTQSTDTSQSPTPTPSSPATRTPVPKESMPPAPEPEQNSPETPIDPNQGGTGGSGSGGSGGGYGGGTGGGGGGGYGGGDIAPCADGLELDANGACVPTTPPVEENPTPETPSDPVPNPPVEPSEPQNPAPGGGTGGTGETTPDEGANLGNESTTTGE